MSSLCNSVYTILRRNAPTELQVIEHMSTKSKIHGLEDWMPLDLQNEFAKIRKEAVQMYDGMLPENAKAPKVALSREPECDWWSKEPEPKDWRLIIEYNDGTVASASPYTRLGAERAFKRFDGSEGVIRVQIVHETSQEWLQFYDLYMS